MKKHFAHRKLGFIKDYFGYVGPKVEVSMARYFWLKYTGHRVTTEDADVYFCDDCKHMCPTEWEQDEAIAKVKDQNVVEHASGNISGIDTSKWTVGDDLFLDPKNPGAVTNVKPPAIIREPHRCKEYDVLLMHQGMHPRLPRPSRCRKYEQSRDSS